MINRVLARKKIQIDFPAKIWYDTVTNERRNLYGKTDRQTLCRGRGRLLEAGYDPACGKVTVSNRPDLCEFQCNGAMPAATAAHKAPILIANDVAAPNILRRPPKNQRSSPRSPVIPLGGQSPSGLRGDKKGFSPVALPPRGEKGRAKV